MGIIASCCSDTSVTDDSDSEASVSQSEALSDGAEDLEASSVKTHIGVQSDARRSKYRGISSHQTFRSTIPLKSEQHEPKWDQVELHVPLCLRGPKRLTYLRITTPNPCTWEPPVRNVYLFGERHTQDKPVIDSKHAVNIEDWLFALFSALPTGVTLDFALEVPVLRDALALAYRDPKKALVNLTKDELEEESLSGAIDAIYNRFRSCLNFHKDACVFKDSVRMHYIDVRRLPEFRVIVVLTRALKDTSEGPGGGVWDCIRRRVDGVNDAAAADEDGEVKYEELDEDDVANALQSLPRTESDLKEWLEDIRDRLKIQKQMDAICSRGVYDHLQRFWEDAHERSFREFSSQMGQDGWDKVEKELQKGPSAEDPKSDGETEGESKDEGKATKSKAQPNEPMLEAPVDVETFHAIGAWLFGVATRLVDEYETARMARKFQDPNPAFKYVHNHILYAGDTHVESTVECIRACPAWKVEHVFTTRRSEDDHCLPVSEENLSQSRFTAVV